MEAPLAIAQQSIDKGRPFSRRRHLLSALIHFNSNLSLFNHRNAKFPSGIHSARHSTSHLKLHSAFRAIQLLHFTFHLSLEAHNCLLASIPLCIAVPERLESKDTRIAENFSYYCDKIWWVSNLSRATGTLRLKFLSGIQLQQEYQLS
jgi:hypothetical protein